MSSVGTKNDVGAEDRRSRNLFTQMSLQKLAGGVAVLTRGNEK